MRRARARARGGAPAPRGAPPARRRRHRDRRVPGEGLQAVLLAAPQGRSHSRQEGLQCIRGVEQVRGAEENVEKLDGEV